MIYRLAWRSWTRRRGRAALAVAGVAVAAALLLDMRMLGAGLEENFAALVRARGYGLRLTPRGALPFDTDAGLRPADRLATAVATVPGVAAVVPVLGAQLYRLAGDRVLEAIFAVGLPPRSRAVFLLVAGEDLGPGRAVVSRPLAEALRLRPGDTLHLGTVDAWALGQPRTARTVRVAGVGEFLYDYAGQRSVALALEDLRALVRRPNEASLFLVAAQPGIDETALARAIEGRVSQVAAYSTADLLREIQRRLFYFRQLAAILTGVSLVVAALLVGTLVTVEVRERFADWIVLRALGVPRIRVAVAIVALALLFVVPGVLLGVPLALAVADVLDGILRGLPGFPARLRFFVWDAERALVGLGALLAVGAAAGMPSAWWIARLPLGRALREEAE